MADINILLEFLWPCPLGNNCMTLCFVSEFMVYYTFTAVTFNVHQNTMRRRHLPFFSCLTDRFIIIVLEFIHAETQSDFTVVDSVKSL